MITHPTVVAKLNDADRMLWRGLVARENSIDANPRAYNRDEIEAHYRQKFALFAEFIERYALEDSPAVTIMASTGIIYYTGDK